MTLLWVGGVFNTEPATKTKTLLQHTMLIASDSHTLVVSSDGSCEIDLNEGVLLKHSVHALYTFAHAAGQSKRQECSC